MHAAILSLLLLCAVVHHGNCLPQKENYVSIEAKLTRFLHRITKTNVDEQARRKDSGTAAHFPITSDKRTAAHDNLGSDDDTCSGAEPVELTENSGTIQSPGYATSTYPSYARCQWLITAPSGYAIAVTFQDVSLEEHARCIYDSLTLYDGPSADSPQLAKVCSPVATPTISSSGSSVFVVFAADSSANVGGFSLGWKFVSQSGQAQRTCGSPAVEPSLTVKRIVGGVEARKNSWPWQCLISLEFEYGLKRRKCGGSVVDSRHILTAAHCFYHKEKEGSLTFKRIPDDGVTVACGVHNREDLSDPAIQRFTEVTSILHESYRPPSYDGDIALIRLPTALRYTDYVQPICLPSSPVPAGTSCVVAGWGNTQETGDNTVLRQIEVPVISFRECDFWLRLTENMMCAGYLEGGKDSCSGDSGGPLVCKQGDTWLQYGIVSHGRGCARPNSPGVYTDVVKFLPWIEEQTGIQTIMITTSTTTSVPTTTTTASTATTIDTCVDPCGAQPAVCMASPGTIFSPGYDLGSYPNNSLCQWRFTAPPGYVVSVSFDELSLEDDLLCRYDSVTLYDGSSDSSRWMSAYCTAAPDTVTSSGSSLFVVFKSDSSVNDGRFSLSWTFVSEDGRAGQRTLMKSKDDSKPPGDLYGAEKELLDLLQRKLSDD